MKNEIRANIKARKSDLIQKVLFADNGWRWHGRPDQYSQMRENIIAAGYKITNSCGPYGGSWIEFTT